MAKLKAEDDVGMMNLRAMLKSVCLRRTKDTISGNLPGRKEEIKYLEFTYEEKTLYDNHKQKLSNCNFPRANTFQELLKLRLICNHGKDLLQQADYTLLCSNCESQLSDWEMEADQMPCAHRALCRGCMYNLEAADKEIGNSDLGCQLCFESQNMLGHSMQMAFPYYQGPSTKVKELIASINRCTLEDIAKSVYPISKQ